MEWIFNRPPRIGVKVFFKSSEGGRLSDGIYTVVETDEYDMAGQVVIEAADGQRYGADAEKMEILELHSDFLAMETPEGYDGLTFLPSEATLRAHGFTDHRPSDWYYSDRVGSGESFEITIPKEPVGTVLSEPVYGYIEGVIDEAFGQHAYFGRMRDQFRYPLAEKISSKLSTFLKLGLRLQVNPSAYGWKEWPQTRPLIGLDSDRATLEALRGAGAN